MDHEEIRRNIERIRGEIAAAAARAGRDPAAVRLMAVTKTVDDERIRAAIEAGVDMIGENYVQEARRKIEAMGRDVPWHLIGHLQTNKAKYAVRLFEMIHSVDRPEVAEELDRRAAALGRSVKVLIEVNVSGEATKRGVAPQDLVPLARLVSTLPSLSLRGLMTMAPWSEDPETARPYFAALRRRRDEIAALNLPGVVMEELSMGMTDDYTVAVEEGATIVRIGRAIFGERG
ncbi:MAG TPA: YggS family pyridoxal phosphate-dependent enzyme [Syntrophales bacterium]|nr:YggS family pyridoxal phosphate-dependent enzyme [Syntrophales bacterium]HPC01819.1 YggS family pyridoxal phosphate-dependent enzyme [Syntrophales bacterium]HRS87638.1 YggS family pyridoxal phosphate-dependent enzyme [Syntrophales bacterium]HRV43216.1 YggS family pyridoxal phosphate-dependent enzyme [Syntrophales bacterium]